MRCAIASGGAILGWWRDTPVAAARWELYPRWLYVSRVAVLPAYRGRGIASAIMEYAAPIARADGRSRLRVGVRQSLPHNVALHARLGFRIASLESHAGGADTVVWMERHLTP